MSYINNSALVVGTHPTWLKTCRHWLKRLQVSATTIERLNQYDNIQRNNYSLIIFITDKKNAFSPEQVDFVKNFPSPCYILDISDDSSLKRSYFRNGMDFLKFIAITKDELDNKLERSFFRFKTSIKHILRTTPPIINTNEQDALHATVKVTIPNTRPFSDKKLALIGISTGGPRALEKILSTAASNCPPIFIVQHMPHNFIGELAISLDNKSTLQVKIAEHGETLKSGHVYLAPGNFQSKIKYKRGLFTVEFIDEAPLRHCKPSIDFTWQSLLSEPCLKHLACFILTGMGDDGVRSMIEMKKKNALCIAQDKESCSIFGMPQAAIKENAVDLVLSLDDICTIFKDTLKSTIR